MKKSKPGNKHTTILKVQLPMFSNQESPPALVYNEDRSYEAYLEVTPSLLKTMKRQPKKYFYASYNPKLGSYIITKEALKQDW